MRLSQRFISYWVLFTQENASVKKPNMILKNWLQSILEDSVLYVGLFNNYVDQILHHFDPLLLSSGQIYRHFTYCLPFVTWPPWGLSIMECSVHFYRGPWIFLLSPGKIWTEGRGTFVDDTDSSGTDPGSRFDFDLCLAVLVAIDFKIKCLNPSVKSLNSSMLLENLATLGPGLRKLTDC